MKVYRNEKLKKKIYETYDHLLAEWEVPVQEQDIETFYGSTHIIRCGNPKNAPLVLFHGVGDDSALMWIYNAKALSAHFSIYAVDTIGGPGKSRPNEHYTKDFDEAKWLDEVFDKLSLKRFYAAGVSNGSHMAMSYKVARPDRVTKLIYMSGTPSMQGDDSPLKVMMKVFLPEALIPTKKNVVRLIRKLSGEHSSVFTGNPTIMDHYYWLLKGFNNMSMTYHKIQFFSEDEMKSIRDKALFLCGTLDPLGDVEKAKAKMERLHLDYRFFPGAGHGINHEISEEINRIIIAFFSPSGAEVGQNTN